MKTQVQYRMVISVRYADSTATQIAAGHSHAETMHKPFQWLAPLFIYKHGFSHGLQTAQKLLSRSSHTVYTIAQITLVFAEMKRTVAHVMYSVKHAMYSVSQVMYSVSQVMYSVTHVMYSVTHAMYSVSHVMYSVSHVMYSVTHVMCSIKHVIYSVAHVMSPISHTIYSVAHVMSPVSHAMCTVTHAMYAIAHVMSPISHTMYSVAHAMYMVSLSMYLDAETMFGFIKTMFSVVDLLCIPDAFTFFVPLIWLPDKNLKSVFKNSRQMIVGLQVDKNQQICSTLIPGDLFVKASYTNMVNRVHSENPHAFINHTVSYNDNGLEITIDSFTVVKHTETRLKKFLFQSGKIADQLCKRLGEIKFCHPFIENTGNKPQAWASAVWQTMQTNFAFIICSCLYGVSAFNLFAHSNYCYNERFDDNNDKTGFRKARSDISLVAGLASELLSEFRPLRIVCFDERPAFRQSLKILSGRDKSFRASKQKPRPGLVAHQYDVQ